MNCFTKNSNLKKKEFVFFLGDGGGGVMGKGEGEGGSVSEFFYKEFKSKKNILFSGGRERGGARVSDFFY